MPKKGGRKGGGGMAEEERLVYMQQRAQAEEDMAKRKEEMLTQFLKDKLQREEKNTSVNLLKLNQQWRAIFRQKRAAEQHSDIAVLRQTFERKIDHKDAVVKGLVCDLDEAEQQSAQARRSHLQCVDLLQSLHQARLAALQQQWGDGLEELSTEFNSERGQILALHQQDCAYLEDVTFAMQLRYSEVDSETQQDYQSSRNEIKNRSMEEKHALRIQLEEKVKVLWHQAQEALKSYNEATEDRRIAFESMRSRDQSNAQEIDMQMKKLQKLQESTCALRAKLISSQRESEAEARGLRAARDETALKVRQLKAQMSRARAAERSRLADVAMHSNAAVKKLQGVIAKGERILRRAELCRKLESEREKVLPFYTSSLTAEEQSQEPPPNELAKAVLDYSELEQFWQRYNKVRLEQVCLEREREVVTRENQKLKDLLRQHLDGISVSDETLRQNSPLLTLSQPIIVVGLEGKYF
ncbi:dynein regulatory complex subunit 2 [Diretmus argenteus]